MKIVSFSTEDISGGAAKAAYRLHSALRERGHNSRMVALNKRSEDDDIYQVPPPPSPLRHALSKRLKERIPGLGGKTPVANYTFNFDFEPDINQQELFSALAAQVDIICLHWIADLLNARLIRQLYDHFRCPVVWVMADQDPMTGGCHYSFDCDGFTKQCGRCPQLDSGDPDDYSHKTWERKQQYLSSIPICFVAPTSWGMKRIRQSSLFGDHRVELIPYPVDMTIFRPLDQSVAREVLQLPRDKKILFFGATYLEDRRKGMKQLIEALAILAELIEAEGKLKREDVFLLVAGLNAKSLMPQLPFAGRYAGHFNDDLTLALAYQVADVFVCPSIEDAGPMMIPEAMMCGAPVVAFDSTGAPDLVETMKTGYLAKAADARDFARGIYALLLMESLSPMRKEVALAAAKSHAPSSVADRHIKLYQSLRAAGVTPRASASG
jgi:glycosyltransferase involved in cell wall biosynthesis